MYLEYPEGIVNLGITTKEFLEDYFILLVKLMCGNIYVALLYLRLLAKYLVNK